MKRLATAGTVVSMLLLATGAQAQEAEEEAGIAVTDQLVIETCNQCHRVDDDGMMTRVSYMRKTPEGWQQSIRRMVTLNDVELEPEAARDIVRYLSDHHGIAPDELRPARFEVERRLIDWSYEGDEDVTRTCALPSMGRVVTRAGRGEGTCEGIRGYNRSRPQGFRRSGRPIDARKPAPWKGVEGCSASPDPAMDVCRRRASDSGCRHVGVRATTRRGRLRHGGDLQGATRGSDTRFATLRRVGRRGERTGADRYAG